MDSPAVAGDLNSGRSTLFIATAVALRVRNLVDFEPS